MGTSVDSTQQERDQRGGKEEKTNFPKYNANRKKQKGIPKNCGTMANVSTHA